MNRRYLRFAVVLLMGIFSSITADAQKTMDVSKFTRMDNDLMARVTKPVKDNDEGKLCALIRVVTPLTDLEVRADALGIVQQEKHAGELWLYVPYGAHSLSFAHDGYFPLLYQYALPIEEGTVYELRLSSFDTSTDAMAQNSNTQLFVLTHNPDEAKVYIDEMEMPSENGVFASMMSKGQHHYRVAADRYENAEGTFDLTDQPVRETVKLHPLFGTLQLLTQPEDGFHVSINGQEVGMSPYKSGRLAPGRYKIHIEKKDFVDVDTIVRLREGDNLNLTMVSEDYHFFNKELGGHKVSFGVNVGYLLPFVSSTSGGSYTGSPINYSLGNSQEDVSYTSQSGFTAGIMADFKLYKNFYLIAGVNYSQIKYTNKFNKPINNDIILTDNLGYYIGNRNNKFEEDYTVGWIEVPLLASYRFVLTKASSFHLNLGPYLAYGLSSKMKLSGSSECSGDIYNRHLNNEIDWDHITGSFVQNYHIEGEFDMYSNQLDYKQTFENATGAGGELARTYSFTDSPYNKLNYGLKLGATYELRGFQINLNYNFQLSNMANNSFWESQRVPVFNEKTGANSMSGYKHKIHALELKVGYIFRY